MTHRGIVRTPRDVIDRKVFPRRAHRQHRCLVLQVIQIERPVCTAGQKHTWPALAEFNPVHWPLVALVGLQVLFVVGNRAPVQGAVLGAGDIRRGVGRVEVQGQPGGGVADPALALKIII